VKRPRNVDEKYHRISLRKLNNRKYPNLYRIIFLIDALGEGMVINNLTSMKIWRLELKCELVHKEMSQKCYIS
jgi:hypothetical protein